MQIVLYALHGALNVTVSQQMFCIPEVKMDLLFK